MTRKSLPFRGAESVLDPLTIESEMRIAALRAASRAAAAAAQDRPPQPMKSRDPLADVLALYTDPPRRPSPLSAITVNSLVQLYQAARQLRQSGGGTAQNWLPQPTESRNPLAGVVALYTNPPRRPSPLSTITVSSLAQVYQAAQQLCQIPGVAAQNCLPQPMESRNPLAGDLPLYTDPPRRPSPLSAITVNSLVQMHQAAQQLRRIPGIAAQARADDTVPAQISPAEARLLQLLGGSGRVDRFGIRHFDNPAVDPGAPAPGFSFTAPDIGSDLAQPAGPTGSPVGATPGFSFTAPEIDADSGQPTGPRAGPVGTATGFSFTAPDIGPDLAGAPSSPATQSPPGPSPDPQRDAAATPPNPLMRRADETDEDWTRRMQVASNAAMRRYLTDPSGAATDMRAINAAIAATPGFTQALPAYLQSVSPDFFRNPNPAASRVKPFADADLDGMSTADRINQFVATNQNPWLKIAADGTVYDISGASDAVRQPTPWTASVYQENNRLIGLDRQNTAMREHGLAGVAPELWYGALASGPLVGGMTRRVPAGTQPGEPLPQVGPRTQSQRLASIGLGPYAGESIAARSTGRDFTNAERAEINRIGSKTGCHTCGTIDPGTKLDNFVPDHQPASALNPPGGPQRLYPQCVRCSRQQGLDISRLKQGGYNG